jgi:hypothetical protein
MPRIPPAISLCCFASFSFIFPPTSGYKKLDASLLRTHILPPPVENASTPHHDLRHAPPWRKRCATTTAAPSQEPAPPQADKEEFYAGLPDNAAAEEATAKQRALLASFETQWHDEAVRNFMHGKRRAAAERLGDA